MKQRFFFSLFLLISISFNLSAYAQSRETDGSEHVKQRMLEYVKKRNNYIFEKANITEDEKISVVKALNQFDISRQKLWSTSFELGRKIRKNDNNSEEDYSNALKQEVLYLQNQADILEELITNLSKDLSNEKTYKIIKAERSYNRHTSGKKRDREHKQRR